MHARRSLVALADRAARDEQADLPTIPDVAPPVAVDFVEVKAEDTSEVEVVLAQLGLVFGGQHRTKPVRLWRAGTARLLLNEQHARGTAPHTAAIGLQYDDVATAEARAEALGLRRVPRKVRDGDQRLPAFAAPHGVDVYLGPAATEPAWVGEFEHGVPGTGTPCLTVDHVNVAAPGTSRTRPCSSTPRCSAWRPAPPLRSRARRAWSAAG